MAFGITQHDVLDPNLLARKYEELDLRFNKLPLGVSEEVSDKIRENLHGWGNFYYNHPTGFSDPTTIGDEPAYAIKSWCKGGIEAMCTEGTRWNQVYRETLALLEKAEAATAGQEELKPEEGGEVIRKEKIDITAMKPLWWLLVPVVFLLGGALIIKPRRLREGGPLPKPVPVEGVDDAGDVEDCGCDDGGLGDPPAHHLDRAAQSITLFNEQIGFLRKSVKGDCREAFADLLGAEHQRSIALTNLNTVIHDPESTEKEVAAAQKESKQLERFEIIFTKLEDKFTSACVR